MMQMMQSRNTGREMVMNSELLRRDQDGGSLFADRGMYPTTPSMASEISIDGIAIHLLPNTDCLR